MGCAWAGTVIIGPNNEHAISFRPARLKQFEPKNWIIWNSSSGTVLLGTKTLVKSTGLSGGLKIGRHKVLATRGVEDRLLLPALVVAPATEVVVAVKIVKSCLELNSSTRFWSVAFTQPSAEDRESGILRFQTCL